ncbi:MAG TPA: hypothetical protein VGA18_05195, partial [Rhodothermales bacterium]
MLTLKRAIGVGAFAGLNGSEHMTFGRHVHLVPKDPVQNIRWRRRVIANLQADKDGSLAADLWQLCAEDILFYVNGFVSIHEPRPLVSSFAVIPFVTWDFQDEAFEDICGAIEGGENLCVVKSRDMGASWMILTSFEWFWHFREAQTFLLVSRNEDYVDKPGDMKALFQKIDFIHKRLPLQLMPRMTRVKNHLGNNDLDSAINGESTTGEVAAGNRLTAIGIDEFAKFKVTDGFKSLGATQFATDCRIFNSTFKTTADAFHAVSENKNIRKLHLPWWKHPQKSIGLYTDENGKKRSPYYDKQCLLADDPHIIACELDMNPAGAQANFFDHDMLDKLQKSTAVEPYVRGELEFDRTTGEFIGFVENEQGRLLLWTTVFQGRTPQGNYAAGVDISSGSGQSNSVISIVDRDTRQKIAEWADPTILPEQFAYQAAAIFRWFGEDVFVVPETCGPGIPFIHTLNDVWGGNIHMRTNIERIDEPVQMSMGFHANPNTIYNLMVQYRRALSDGSFINRSHIALEECRHYVYGPNQTV